MKRLLVCLMVLLLGCSIVYAEDMQYYSRECIYYSSELTLRENFILTYEFWQLLDSEDLDCSEYYDCYVFNLDTVIDTLEFVVRVPIEYPYASFYILTEDGNYFGADIYDYDDVDDSYYLSYCCDLTDYDFIYFIVMYDGCGC